MHKFGRVPYTRQWVVLCGWSTNDFGKWTLSSDYIFAVLWNLIQVFDLWGVFFCTGGFCFLITAHGHSHIRTVLIPRGKKTTPRAVCVCRRWILFFFSVKPMATRAGQRSSNLDQTERETKTQTEAAPRAGRATVNLTAPVLAHAIRRAGPRP